MPANVNLEKRGAIAVMTLNRPQKLNAFHWEMMAEMADAMHEIDRDPEVRAGILHGEGRAFCSGADLALVHSGFEGRSWEPLEMRSHDTGWEMKKPMVACIHGYCLAGGLELAVACDIRVCAADAQFGAPEVKWNLLHGYGALRMPDIIPMSDAMLLLLTGRFIAAEEAHRIGLVSRVLPTKDDAMREAMSIAEDIAANGPVAVQMTKDLVQRGRHSILDGLRLYMEYNRVVHSMQDVLEGAKAFQERRKPAYRGR